MDQHLAAGVVPVPAISDIDISSKNAEGEDVAKGVDAEMGFLLSDEEFMKELGINYQDVLEFGKTFEIKLEWKGGEESYELSAEVIDES